MLEHAPLTLHVMTNLHVRYVVQTVVRHHVTPRFEKHHGDWATGLHVADNELRDNVQTSLLICDGLNDT